MKHNKRKTGATTEYKDKGNGGFTLVEMLVAVTVLAISLLAVAPLLTTALTLDRDSQLKVKAQAQAAYKMDDLMAQGVTVTPCGGGPALDCKAAYSCTEYIDADTEAVYNTIIPATDDPCINAMPAGTNYCFNRRWDIAPVPGAQLCQMVVRTTYTIKGELKTFRVTANKGRTAD